MNLDRVLAELPPDMGTWMQTHATPTQWAETGRAVGISIGHELLSSEGEGGNQRLTHARLLASDSPAVRTLTRVLGCGGRRWSRSQVAAAIVTYFELWGFTRLERRLSRLDKLPTAKAA